MLVVSKFISLVVQLFQIDCIFSPQLAMNHYCFRSITGLKVFNLESSSTLKNNVVQKKESVKENSKKLEFVTAF